MRRQCLSQCLILTLFAVLFVGGAISAFPADLYRREWPDDLERIWIGPDFWANRLQDWRLSGGRLECVLAAEGRNVFLLTREVADRPGDLFLRVRLGQPADETETAFKGWIGYMIGVKGEFDEYRDSAVRGKGLRAGVTTAGTFFVGDPPADEKGGRFAAAYPDGVELVLISERTAGPCTIRVAAFDPDGAALIGEAVSRGHDPADLAGGLALVSDLKPIGPAKGTSVRGAWFADWRIEGSRVDSHDERAFGPVLFSQYTLSGGVLKMTAQMPPVGAQDGKTVSLQVDGNNDGNWKTVAVAPIDPHARTATLRVEGWDASRPWAYRLWYELRGRRGPISYFRTGTIREEPLHKEEIVVAAFTGNNDLGFPNNDLVTAVGEHDPDLLFFSGDQIYEGVGGFGCQRAPVDKAMLDYLRKWYLYGWAHGEMMRDRPTVAIPDDHDVYHGNIWGAGGKATQKEGGGMEQQDSGGYKMPAVWVKMVERTQTSHLPDPFDPTPVEQGIGVYYCAMNYGGVSFAIIEDRKFKSPPKVVVPEGKIRNGWSQNPDFDAAKSSDVPGAVLLGERQLAFLDHWAADWSHGAWMKVVLSQTIFANVATLPDDSGSDAPVPRLRILEKGQYAENDKIVSDLDSNGWPKTGRDRALRAMQRGFAVHLAGDQHLGSTVQYGVDDWNDAAFALCVPSVSNVWPRRWFPPEPGANRAEGAPKYTGEFHDGFGNKITVHAVSNPVFTGKKPARLYDRATGFGIARFRKKDRTISLANWPRWPSSVTGGSEPYEGWPVVFKQADNYGRKAFGFLPEIMVKGLVDPVVQLFDEADGKLVYTLRINGTTFRPKVFHEGLYTIKVAEPDEGKTKIIQGLAPGDYDTHDALEIVF